jgi:two-component system, NtrC family, response regulator HydG
VRLRAFRSLVGRVRILRQVVGSRPSLDDTFPEIDGTSGAVGRLKAHMACVARDPDITVLIAGESGTGKERVARAIHRASPRSALPLVVIDCAGLAATLVEDQLFGHIRGAFTGAVDDQMSPFERADGGTILLDEVGDLSLDLQMKLLRTIQARMIQRLGSRRETPFDVRVIASTNVDLAVATAHGRFRQDLYYRLRVYEITVPPLRDRGVADIAALTTAILARLSQRRRRPPPSLDREAFEALTRHDWPGNVRELENTLERMLVAAAHDTILGVRHMPEGFAPRSRRTTSAGAPRVWPSPAEALEALARNGARFGRTAADLGLSRHQLYRMLKRHGLRP